jgi:hypothetical protein
MQTATELERNPSVSCLHSLVLVLFLIIYRLQDSGLGFFANAQNTVITGGTFVSHSRRLHKPSVIMHVVGQQCLHCQYWQWADKDPCNPQTKLQFTVYWTERCA